MARWSSTTDLNAPRLDGWATKRQAAFGEGRHGRLSGQAKRSRRASPAAILGCSRPAYSSRTTRTAMSVGSLVIDRFATADELPMAMALDVPAAAAMRGERPT